MEICHGRRNHSGSGERRGGLEPPFPLFILFYFILLTCVHTCLHLCQLDIKVCVIGVCVLFICLFCLYIYDLPFCLSSTNKQGGMHLLG